MNKKQIIEKLEQLEKDLQDKENQIYQDIAFFREHKFAMEEAAVRYKQQAYNDAWLMLWKVIDEIKKS